MRCSSTITPLVLGWSPRLPTILSELSIANENRKHAAHRRARHRDKDEVEDELRRPCRTTERPAIVCRTGDLANIADLRMVIPSRRVRSSCSATATDGDAGVVKAVLAVRSVDPTFDGPVVAELDDADIADRCARRHRRPRPVVRAETSSPG